MSLYFFLMACLIDGSVLFEYFPTKVEGQRVEKGVMKHRVGRKPGRRESVTQRRRVKVKERSRGGHGNVIVRSSGRLEKRAPFINASSQSQHGGMQWPDH